MQIIHSAFSLEDCVQVKKSITTCLVGFSIRVPKYGASYFKDVNKLCCKDVVNEQWKNT